jgi:hypothetical protein
MTISWASMMQFILSKMSKFVAFIKTLKNQNEELKKQIHIMKNRFNSVFAAYEALLLLQEQTQKTLQQQNVILQKQGNEIKNMITI